MPTEVVEGVELPSYRGDIVNELAFTPEARIPDPAKMLQAYTQAAATLNLLRAFSTGGYADMHQVHQWTLGFTEGEKAAKYRDMASRITDTLDFIRAAGVSNEQAHTLHRCADNLTWWSFWLQGLAATGNTKHTQGPILPARMRGRRARHENTSAQTQLHMGTLL